MVLLLQTIGACTAVHILTPGFVGGSQGIWDLGGGEGKDLFSGIYGELDSGGCVREQGFDEHILRSWGER